MNPELLALLSRLQAPAALSAPTPPPGPPSSVAPPFNGLAANALGPPNQPAQATGPDVIQKLMSYFNNKSNPTDG